jgi:triosephosphate isomerase
MKRAPLIAGNWKMYKTAQEAKSFISLLSKELPKETRVRIFLAVPFTAIESSAHSSSSIVVGAQNMHDHLEGAFTGEISARMLKSAGAQFVILGHSERRQLFLETNSFIHRKVKRALEEELIPILCVGETLEEREGGSTESVLQQQLEECLQGLQVQDISSLIIAYEPIWAIGTGKTATPEIAQAVHHFIRSWLKKRFDASTAHSLTLLYGGSVKPDNIASLMHQPDIDGALVGGASLDPHSFIQLVHKVSS